MNDQQKLRVLIPHWIEHNSEHVEEFLQYAVKAGDAETDLREAGKQMELANQALANALEKLGGALSLNYAPMHHH